MAEMLGKAGRPPILHGIVSLYRKTPEPQKARIDEHEFPRPYKFLLPGIVTSEVRLPHALDLANAFQLVLERKGHRVTFVPSGQRGPSPPS